MEWQFFLLVLVGGLLAGVMYSLVALGFVLIYKASGVFNFAQGAMVLFAALSFVSIQAMGVPFWLALLLTLVLMVGLGVGIERVVLRPLVNQPPITLFMATIGLSFFLEAVTESALGTIRVVERLQDLQARYRERFQKARQSALLRPMKAS